MGRAKPRTCEDGVVRACLIASEVDKCVWESWSWCQADWSCSAHSACELSDAQSCAQRVADLHCNAHMQIMGVVLSGAHQLQWDAHPGLLGPRAAQELLATPRAASETLQVQPCSGDMCRSGQRDQGGGRADDQDELVQGIVALGRSCLAHDPSGRPSITAVQQAVSQLLLLSAAQSC
jgi:hypothetical protein